MFAVLLDSVVYTAVAEIEGRWIDGNSGYDVTGGKLLGTFYKAIYANGRRFEYYRQGRDVYQLCPDGRLMWFCAWEVVDTLLP